MSDGGFAGCRGIQICLMVTLSATLMLLHFRATFSATLMSAHFAPSWFLPALRAVSLGALIPSSFSYGCRGYHWSQLFVMLPWDTIDT